MPADAAPATTDPATDALQARLEQLEHRLTTTSRSTRIVRDGAVTSALVVGLVTMLGSVVTPWAWLRFTTEPWHPVVLADLFEASVALSDTELARMQIALLVIAVLLVVLPLVVAALGRMTPRDRGRAAARTAATVLLALAALALAAGFTILLLSQPSTPVSVAAGVPLYATGMTIVGIAAAIGRDRS